MRITIGEEHYEVPDLTGAMSTLKKLSLKRENADEVTPSFFR